MTTFKLLLCFLALLFIPVICKLISVPYEKLAKRSKIFLIAFELLFLIFGGTVMAIKTPGVNWADSPYLIVNLLLFSMVFSVSHASFITESMHETSGVFEDRKGAISNHNHFFLKAATAQTFLMILFFSFI